MPGNTETYKAILKCERWRDAIGLSVRDTPRLAEDMQAVIDALKIVSADNKRLKLSNLAIRQERAPPLRRRERPWGGTGVPAHLDVREKAIAVAEAAADKALDLYALPVGTLRWFPRGFNYEGRGRLIGSYDMGCDWRRIMEDLEL